MRIGTKSWGPSQIGAPARPQNRPILGPILRAPGPGAQGPLGHLNVRERVFGPIPAQKGLRIGLPRASPGGPILRPPRPGLGGPGRFLHGWGGIWAQSCSGGLQEGLPRRPIWAPQGAHIGAGSEAKSLRLPPCFKDLLFTGSPNMGPPEQPQEPRFRPCSEAKSLRLPPCL